MHVTPTTANVKAGNWNPWIVIAAPTADTPAPASASTRRGPIPKIEISGATTAATAHAITRSFIACWLDATKIGNSRYSTVIATTGHTAWTIADAAGAEVVAVVVTHECSGHNASRPATPMKSSTE